MSYQHVDKFLNNAFKVKEVLSSNDFKAKRKMIIDLGSNLRLKNRQLIFTFRKPYDVLLKPSFRTNVLGD